MLSKKAGVDVIADVLRLALEAYPDSEFVKSQNRQYMERGGLSKKQLEGLYAKSSKAGNVPAGKLATLEAVILKKHTNHRSERPGYTPLFTKDERIGKLIADILQKYPQHKRLLFLKGKFDNNDIFSVTEKEEVEKFYKLLLV